MGLSAIIFSSNVGTRNGDVLGQNDLCCRLLQLGLIAPQRTDPTPRIDRSRPRPCIYTDLQ